MRCNACWKELEGRAISTTCGHLLCPEDASKIINDDAACPICDQVLSKSLMKPVDINPGEEWINMANTGISPQILMKSAYRSVMFFIGQKELEMQYKMNKIIAQCRQKCEGMQEKFTEKLEQLHTAYQKMSKRCQMMEQEIENLSKDKQELQEKFGEKSRQKRKLDEMYDQLRDPFTNTGHIENNRDLFRQALPNIPVDLLGADPSLFTPDTPGKRDDLWSSGRIKNSNSGQLDLSGGSFSPLRQPGINFDAPSNRRNVRPDTGAVANNPSAALRNFIISPLRRPQLSRSRAQLFTL